MQRIIIALVFMIMMSTASVDNTWNNYELISKTNPECEPLSDYVPTSMASYTDLMHLKWSCTNNVVSITQHLTNDCTDNAQYTYPIETDDGNCQKILDAWYTVTCDASSIDAQVCVGSSYTTPEVDTWVPDWGWTYTTPEVPDATSTCGTVDNAAAVACAAAGSISQMACEFASCTYHTNGCVYGSVTLYCMPSLDCVYTLENEYKVTLDSNGGCGTFEEPDSNNPGPGGANNDDSTASILSLLCFFAFFFHL